MALRKRIGVIVPSTNTTCEADFQLAASEDITIHGHRLWITNEAIDKDGTDRMNHEIQDAARYLATARVDVIGYGCTTGSFYRGVGWDTKMIEIIEEAAGVPAVVTSPSVVEALRFFEARKISVATPYAQWVNDQLRVYLESQGFEVLNVEAEPWASQAGNQETNDQDPEVIIEFASKVCRPDADAMLCSCTAWRSMEVVDELERRISRPVVTSNQATIWAAFREAGIVRPVQGFGKLLENIAVLPTL
uniref:Maleate cis-trans isomerase n=1 Tax=uncultured Chloroflexi bacterium HF0500_03M05 TaxID=710737 RepID=E0XY61_9CHLR|nr:maleate cis-trans isomerase [uncultured Chloroflexi bacterium HF0500_03M05]